MKVFVRKDVSVVYSYFEAEMYHYDLERTQTPWYRVQQTKPNANMPQLCLI